MNSREKAADFGLDASNPILTTGIPESYNYLDRLITEENDDITYERISQVSSPNVKINRSGIEVDAPIDYFIIYDSSGKEITGLYICPYFKENSTSAPKGFMFRTSSSIKSQRIIPDNIDSNTDELEPMNDEDVDEEVCEGNENDTVNVQEEEHEDVDEETFEEVDVEEDEEM